MLNTLLERITPFFTEDSPHILTSLDNLMFFHTDKAMKEVVNIQSSGMSLVLQGSKTVQIGNQLLHHQIGDVSCYAFDLPIIVEYHDTPYSDIRMYLPHEMIDRQAQKLTLNELYTDNQERAVGQASDELIDAFNRLCSILHNPQDLSALTDLYQEEIVYRLLCTPQAALLLQSIKKDSHTKRIAQASKWIKENYNQTISIEKLSSEYGMSPSGFHRYFRQLTGFTPLQYQKNFRLSQARSLLITGHSVSEAGHAVGYESLSQFSREYKRYFGVNPSDRT